MHAALTASLPAKLQRRLRRRAPLATLAAGFGGYWQPKRGETVPWDYAQRILASNLAAFDARPEWQRQLIHKHGEAAGAALAQHLQQQGKVPVSGRFEGEVP